VFSSAELVPTEVQPNLMTWGASSHRCGERQWRKIHSGDDDLILDEGAQTM